jgi:hypothetical protein
MPVNYGSYNLQNSQRVRPFAGSLVPELQSVAGTLQERYDKALETDDMISRAANMAQAAPFAQDQQLLSGLKQEFKDRIAQRVKSSNYEDMLRDTMMDARSFSDRYAPLTANKKAYEDYKAGLNEAVAKGDIKSPEKAQRLLALATQSYKGLQYDPNTGQYSNPFTGVTPVKDIDPTEKVDKWMKDLAPTVLGDKIVFTDGVWKRFREGKTTTLKQNEIDKVLAAGMSSDPEFQGWYNQEQQLATVGHNNVTDQDIDALQNSTYKDALNAYRKRGMTAAQAAQQAAAVNRSQEITNAMRQYSSKYIRDDRETGSGIMDADPYNLERHKKKLAEEELVLSMPILQPEARSTVQGAEDMTSKIQQAHTAVQAARKNYDDWIRTNNLRPDAKGNWVDDKGNDRTLKVLQQRQVYEQAKRASENLQALDAEARRRTGFNPGKNISPTLMAAAERAGQQAAERYRGLISEGSGGFKQATSEELEAAKQRGRSEYLIKNSPGYEPYDKVLRDMTSQGAQLINVQNFNNKPANEQATNLFKNLVLNLDANGLNSGTQGLVWASGDAVGQPLEAGDYKKVAANAQFAGWGMDSDGALKFFYKVGDVKQNAKGALVGENALVKMPALPGTVDVLLKHKQITPAQLAIGQSINSAINQPSGQGYIDIGNGNKVFVDRIDKTEIGTSEPSGGLNLRFPTKDGKYVEVPAASVGDAINTITNAIQRSQTKQK